MHKRQDTFKLPTQPKQYSLGHVAENALWTDTGVDQHFQRDFGAIGPYEFKGIHIDQSLGALFSGKICMDQWSRKSFQERSCAFLGSSGLDAPNEPGARGAIVIPYWP